MRRGVAEPLDRRDSASAGTACASPHLRPSRPVAVIGVDVLPEQRDFARVRVPSAARTSAITSTGGARTRRRAYRARRRTSRTCRNLPAPRRKPRLTCARGAFRQMRRISARRGNPVSTTSRRCRRVRDHVREAMIALRSDHDIDDARARRRISSPSACATQPATPITSRGPLSAAYRSSARATAELRKHLFRRLFTDMAGVEQDDIRFVGASVRT